MDLEGMLYAEINDADGSDRMAMTITEIAHVARAGHTGASEVILHDRGELDPVTGEPVRDVDRVLIRAGELDVELTRDEPDGSWVWQISDHPAEHGEVSGPGDVVRLVHRALQIQNLPLPKGTPHPSRAIARMMGASREVLDQLPRSR